MAIKTKKCYYSNPPKFILLFYFYQGVTKEPQQYSTSTTTFGGVASNTVRPTTKSMLAEMEFPSHHDKPKYQFMHDPEKYKYSTTPINNIQASDLASLWDIIRTSTTTSPQQLNTFGQKLDDHTQGDQKLLV